MIHNHSKLVFLIRSGIKIYEEFEHFCESICTNFYYQVKQSFFNQDAFLRTLLRCYIILITEFYILCAFFSLIYFIYQMFLIC